MSISALNTGSWFRWFFVVSKSLSLSSGAVTGARNFSAFSKDDDNDKSSAAAQNYYRAYEKLFKVNEHQLVSHNQSRDVLPESTLLSTSDCHSSSNSTEISVSPSKLSHVDDAGGVKMVDVGGKSATRRVAVAEGHVSLGPTAFGLVAENRMKKGNVLVTAQIAGIMAAKKTCSLIPLCHHVALTSVDIECTLVHDSQAVRIRCTATSVGQTGVEMEALTGVSVACLTVYDMCKSVSHDIVIGGVMLVSKTGGKSDYGVRE